MGQCAAARSAFQKAIELEPAATYARENLEAIDRAIRRDAEECHAAQVTRP